MHIKDVGKSYVVISLSELCGKHVLLVVLQAVVAPCALFYSHSVLLRDHRLVFDFGPCLLVFKTPQLGPAYQLWGTCTCILSDVSRVIRH